jgi:hypothetical protein
MVGAVRFELTALCSQKGSQLINRPKSLMFFWSRRAALNRHLLITKRLLADNLQ